MARILELRVDKTPFHRLVELEKQKAKIDAEIKLLREQLLPVVQRTTRVVADGYVFEPAVRAKWQYTAKEAELAGQLSARRKYEQLRGLAVKVDEIQYLKMTGVKK